MSIYYDSPLGGTIPHWLVVHNRSGGPPHAGQGWAQSSDINATSFTGYAQGSGLDFGIPNERNAADGHPFAGWGGDGTVVVDYDSTRNHGGRRAYYGAIGESDTNGATDFVVAVTDTGGAGLTAWSNAHYINTAATGGANAIDQPWLASHSISPYSLYGAWEYQLNAYINWFAYDANLVFSHGNSGGANGWPKQIPADPSGKVNGPVIGFGNGTIKCNKPAHELLFVAWSNVTSRCTSTTDRTNVSNKWWVHIYDTQYGWLSSGPVQVDGQTSAWPECIGNPLVGESSTNAPRPMIAVDPNGTDFWVAYDYGTQYGTQIRVRHGALSCSGGVSFDPPWSPPTPCYNTGGCPDGGGNLPDGGIAMNDEWGAAINFVASGSNRNLVVTWYDTRGDMNNNLVDIWGAYSTNATNPFSNMFLVSQAGSGQTVPWDHTVGAWWDYQALGVDLTGATFLAAWGGDARLGSGLDGVWSARIQ